MFMRHGHIVPANSTLVVFILPVPFQMIHMNIRPRAFFFYCVVFRRDEGRPDQTQTGLFDVILCCLHNIVYTLKCGVPIRQLAVDLKKQFPSFALFVGSHNRHMD